MQAESVQVHGTEKMLLSYNRKKHGSEGGQRCIVMSVSDIGYNC